jgi:hypothetical protein
MCALQPIPGSVLLYLAGISYLTFSFPPFEEGL